MKVAALILGLISGLIGLSVASYGSMGVALLSAGGQRGLAPSLRESITLLLYAIPIASLVGGGVSLAAPGFGAALLLLSAVGWFGWVPNLDTELTP